LRASIASARNGDHELKAKIVEVQGVFDRKRQEIKTMSKR
jgi:hypothetical protein